MQQKRQKTLGFLPHGAGGDRTLDLSVANAALSQLSYDPKTLTSKY